MTPDNPDNPGPTGTDPRRSARTGAGLAVVSMLTVQLGIAMAVGLFDDVGPLGAAWLGWRGRA